MTTPIDRVHDSVPVPDRSQDRAAQQCFSDYVNNRPARYTVCPGCDADVDVEMDDPWKPRISQHRNAKTGEHCLASGLFVPGRVVKVRQ